jgi:predicted RNase H-like nuclease (RuvC/YqgF family)
MPRQRSSRTALHEQYAKVMTDNRDWERAYRQQQREIANLRAVAGRVDGLEYRCKVLMQERDLATSVEVVELRRQLRTERERRIELERRLAQKKKDAHEPEG